MGVSVVCSIFLSSDFYCSKFLFFYFQVSSRYFGSSFMGHATAENLEEHIVKQAGDLGLHKLLQLSMDGPNVNLKLHTLIEVRIIPVSH